MISGSGLWWCPVRGQPGQVRPAQPGAREVGGKRKSLRGVSSDEDASRSGSAPCMGAQASVRSAVPMARAMS